MYAITIVFGRAGRDSTTYSLHTGHMDLVIDIGGENAAGETFKLRFDWTGNWQTSFLTGVKRLV